MEDLIRSKTLIKLGLNYEAVNFDSAIIFYSKSMQIAKKHKWYSRQGAVMTNFGFAHFYDGSRDTCFYFFKKALELYQNDKNRKWEMNALYNLGYFYGEIEQFSLSKQYYEQAIPIAIEIDETQRLTDIYGNAGLMCNYLGLYERANKYQFAALRLMEKNGIETTGTVCVNIGINYAEQTNFIQSLLYYKKAAIIFKKMNIQEGLAVALKNIGDVLSEQNKLDSAMSYYNRANKINLVLNDKVSVASHYLSLGTVRYKQKKYKEAERIYDLALESIPAEGNDKLRFAIYDNTLTLFFLMPDTVSKNNASLWDKALKYAIRMEKISKKLGSISMKEKSYKSLYKVYSKVGDRRNALYYIKEYLVVHDTLVSEQKQETITEIQTKYETDKKEKKILFLGKEQKFQALKLKQRNIIISSISILLTISFLLMFFLIKSRKKIQEKTNAISAQKEEISAQVNELKSHLDNINSLTKFKEEITQMLVHDLKNPINQIINLPETLSYAEQREISVFSAQSMLNLVMNILDVKKFEESKLHLNITNQNITHLWQKVVSRFKYPASQKNISIFYKPDFEIETAVDAELMERVFANILSNSLRYTSANGQIDFTAIQNKDNSVCLSIKDNGRGISKEALDSIFQKYSQSGKKVSYSTGLGLSFCKIAIQAHSGTIDIKSEENKGTEVLITLRDITKFKNTKAPHFKKKEMQFVQIEQLKTFLAEFKELDIFQISELKIVIKKMKTQGLENEDWLVAMVAAVRNVNEEQFLKLIAKLEKM